jgi:hypothetical protein
MKLLLLIGGLLGFLIGFIFSWAESSSWPSCLWHACLAAYVTGLLMRWWGNAWMRHLQQSLQDQQSLAMAAQAAANSKAKK